MTNLRDKPITDLLDLYGRIESKFLHRKITQKRGGVVGGLAEELVRRGLGLDDAGHNHPGYDATDSAGRRYQIKGRRGSKGNTMLGKINTFDSKEFDYLVGVIFNSDFTIRHAVKMPFSVARDLAKENKANKGFNVTLTKRVLDRDDVECIKEQLEPYMSEVGTKEKHDQQSE